MACQCPTFEKMLTVLLFAFASVRTAGFSLAHGNSFVWWLHGGRVDRTHRLHCSKAVPGLWMTSPPFVV
jgi:hypothetical protein